MVNKQLADWIKSEESLGYTEKQLKDHLLNQGYNEKDINDAISSLWTQKVNTTFSVNKILKPTILKCFFPVLILVLIVLSFFINSAHLPPIGESFCNSLTSAKESGSSNENTIEKSFENNANTQKSIDSLTPMITVNLYLIFSMTYKLNPFFPTPCEALTLQEDLTNKNSCKYYISEESYNCVNNYINKQKQEGGTSAMIGLFSDNPPPYDKISFTSLIIHSIILIALVYIIISFIAFGNLKISEQSKKIKLMVNGSLIILPILIFFIFHFEYILFLLPPIIILIISSFIKNDKHNNLFLYIMAFVFILILVGGIFITNFIISKNLVGSMIP